MRVYVSFVQIQNIYIYSIKYTVYTQDSTGTLCTICTVHGSEFCWQAYVLMLTLYVLFNVYDFCFKGTVLPWWYMIQSVSTVPPIAVVCIHYLLIDCTSSEKFTKII